MKGFDHEENKSYNQVFIWGHDNFDKERKATFESIMHQFKRYAEVLK